MLKASNTTAPGMFTASPNRHHNFNNYNNSASLASKDGVYGFGSNEPKPKGVPPAPSSRLVPAANVPSTTSSSSSGQPVSAGGSFRNRYPVKSNPISEESEHDLGSAHSSRNSTEYQQHLTAATATTTTTTIAAAATSPRITSSVTQ